jgi:hypothetical protein
VVESRQPQVLVTGILARDPPAAAVLHDLDDEAERLGEAVTDDDVIRDRTRSADAIEVTRERIAKFFCATQVEVAEPIARSLVHHPPDGLHPCLAGELRDVRTTVAEVDPERIEAGGHRRTRPSWLRCVLRRAQAAGDAGSAARAARQVALGDELLVGLDDHPSGQAQLVREGAGRGERRAGRQATRSDRAPELQLELPMERRGIVAAKLDEELAGRTGPRSRHRTGP